MKSLLMGWANLSFAYNIWYRPTADYVFWLLKLSDKVCGRATSPAAYFIPVLPALDWETFQVRC